MSKPFVVGERVAVYNESRRKIGAVIKIAHDGNLIIRYDNKGVVEMFPEHWVMHPKKCRHLKPKKKPREWWINIYEDQTFNYGHEQAAKLASIGIDSFIETVHVREVLEKK